MADEHVGCLARDGRSKYKFLSKSQAKGRAREVAKRNGIKMSVYRCPTCDFWHMTTRRPKK